MLFVLTGFGSLKLTTDFVSYESIIVSKSVLVYLKFIFSKNQS